MPDLILHHYPSSPFSEKMRLVLGYKKLGWKSVVIPAIMPKPDVLALTGGYRKTPFLQVVYNNGGWRAPRFSAAAIHPDGYASRGADIGTSFEPSPDYAGIAAAAGGALAQTIRRADEVEPAVQRALHAVRDEGRCAVIDAIL